ncbi:MBL fold metallo-hydrolase [Consotaella aegiceratis]|uniref:MBL fold metallo-hydrolase n=1 Tax=Consotaella aegiceratis TaxID=3097961 RepID=UPI002F3E3CB5
MAESTGAKGVEELGWWGGVTIGRDTRLSSTPAQHSSARGLFDRDKTLWGRYFIQIQGVSVHLGGDTGYSTRFADIRERLSSPDVALLGIGA